MKAIRKQLTQNGQPYVRQSHLASGATKITTFVPLRLKKRGIRKIVVSPLGITNPIEINTSNMATSAVPDPALLKAIGLACYWQQQIESESIKNAVEIAERECMDRTRVNEVLRLSLLATDIMEKILSGKQPKTLTLEFLVRNTIPLNWDEQQLSMHRLESWQGFRQAISSVMFFHRASVESLRSDNY